MSSWSQVKTLEFIEMYKEHDVLWNTKRQDYKDKEKKHNAWKCLADSFGINCQEAKTKINNLRTQFSSESMKMEKANRSGAAGPSEISKKWFAYESMTFLKDVVQPRKSLSNLSIGKLI